jgi:hypothetical protein
LGDGARACTASHFRAWRQLLDSAHSHALILEDDVEVDPALAEVLAALAAGAMVLLLAAPGSPGRFVLVGAIISAIGVFVLTPLLTGQGDLVLFSIPVPPPLNGDITAEAVAAGAAAAARVLATVALAAAIFAWADPDRMLAGLGRVAPRSALVVMSWLRSPRASSAGVPDRSP